MLFDIPDQPIKSLPRMVARALVVDITEGPFNRVGSRTIARQPQQLKARMSLEPALDYFGLVDFVIVRDDEDASDLRAAKLFQSGEQLPEQRIVLTFPNDIVNLPSPIVERRGQELLLVLPWSLDLPLPAFKHLLIAGFREQVNVEFITPEESVGRL